MKFDQLDQIIKSIESERNLVKKILNWEIDVESISSNIEFKTILMVVESPNKARTIASFFWQPSKRFLKDLSLYEISLWNKLLLITYSGWHIVDLLKKKYLWWVLYKNNGFYPIYESIKRCIYKFNNDETIQVTDDIEKCKEIQIDKRDLIKSLQDSSLEVDEIYIATDPDTEWEKIAYDIYCLLKPFNINVFRVEYHEVTKKAILNAIDNKREIDINWVKAQIVRRIADRWVWFALSKKLQEKYKWKNYSAGRVQTPVLWWIIERDNKSKDKKAVINLYFNNDENELIGNNKWFYYKKLLILEEENIDKINNFKNKKEINLYIKIIEKNTKIQNPFPPFTTDMMLEEANNKYNFWVDKTMQLAQDLFEFWLITYHRTDSTHISNFWISIAEEYLKSNKLEEYFYPRHWWEEGTHEAIRTTRPYDTNELIKLVNAWILNISLNSDHYKLYDLIFKRFIASQMKPFEYENARIDIIFSDDYDKVVDIPINIIKNWWNLILPFGIYKIEEGNYLSKIDIKLIPKILPYTQWSLIKEMKERGLWRPSTYATIISTLLKRKYIVQLPKTWWIKSTKKWQVVYNFLINNYSKLVSEDFTRELEEYMDEIQNWYDYMKVLKKLYNEISNINWFSN